METKEEWINKTMESLDGIKVAECDPLLFNNLLEHFHPPKSNVFSIQSKMILRLAAMILIIISFNVFTLVWFTRSQNNNQDYVKSVANEYFSYMGSINF
jgi:hypothetical protein